MALTCSDCGFPVKNMKPETAAKGSSVRDPGEALCTSCTSARSRLVEQLKAMPDNIRDIQSKRMVRK